MCRLVGGLLTTKRGHTHVPGRRAPITIGWLVEGGVALRNADHPFRGVRSAPEKRRRARRLGDEGRAHGRR